MALPMSCSAHSTARTISSIASCSGPTTERERSMGIPNFTRREPQAQITTPPAIPYAPKPRPSPAEHQNQLGSVTLAAVDQLTGMTADEIERLADDVIRGADDTADVLRELARRVREYGLFANERLSTFVRAANACADTARTMQIDFAKRDEQPPPEQITSEPAVGEVVEKVEEALAPAQS